MLKSNFLKVILVSKKLVKMRCSDNRDVAINPLIIKTKVPSTPLPSKSTWKIMFDILRTLSYC